jgi:pimeloyl-ACP methyl ester carboxylesterase
METGPRTEDLPATTVPSHRILEPQHVSEIRARDVVLLHGQPGTAADWRQLTDRLPSQLRVVALDRPGYGAHPGAAGGFYEGARAVVAELDARGIDRAVLVGHSYGGGVALAAAQIAPERVEALVLLASVGPDCLDGWDRILAAPFAGPVCAVAAWWLTPWVARARLARIARRRGRSLGPEEYVNWHVWGHVHHDHGPMWRTFLTEQRALVRELDRLVADLPRVLAPALVLADPEDSLVPGRCTEALHASLPSAMLRLVSGVGHHLPRRAPEAVAAAILSLLPELDAGPLRLEGVA